jgi:hypothetical protein
MAIKTNIKDSVIPVNLKYMGDVVDDVDISYKYNTYTFASGEQFILKDAFFEPLSINIAKDVFSVITKPRLYTDIFNDIREEKQGSGLKTFNIDALAQDDFIGGVSLSAVQESDGLGSESIIGISYGEDISLTNSVDVVRFSLNTTISYSEANLYWYDNNGVLSSIPSPELLTDDYFFYIFFIDGTYCNIKKVNETGEKYLTYDSGSFIFQETEDELNSRFIYSYNPQESRIFLIIQNTGILGFDESGLLSSMPFDSVVSEIQNSFSLIPKNSLELKEEIRNSFVPTYGVKNNIVKTDNIDTHILITHNYDSNIENNSNTISLKSNTLYDETNTLINTDSNLFYKKYTSLNSGIRGDSGYNNYILGYNCDWYKYTFESDKQTYFNIPFELKGYEQININDCKLIENGAIGGNSPLNSDKIYKKLYEYSDFKNTGITPSVDNSKYLCSWLYYNPLNPQLGSRWLDRYYNPDKTTKLEALSERGWNGLSSLESFSTKQSLVGNYNLYYTEFDKGLGIFDVESKLTIEKDSLYMYEHIGLETSQKLLDEYSNTLLFDVNDKDMDSTEQFTIIPNTYDFDEEFTLNIVLDNFDINKFNGNKIFGNRTLSLTVDKDYSPYSIVVDDSVIKYYDFDYNLISSLDLSSTIDDIIFTDDYNKFFVDCGGKIYTIESLDFITNETTLTDYSNISDIKYYNERLYLLDEVTGEVKRYNYNTDTLSSETFVSSGDNLFLNLNGTVYSSNGEYIDYGDSDDIYTLSSNQIFYKNISTPILSSDDIVDFYVDSNDILFVLQSDKLLKIDNTFITKVIDSVDIAPTYGLSSFDVTRYQRGGITYEYIDIVDKSSQDTVIHRYSKDFELVDTISRNIEGNFIRSKRRLQTKYLDKQLQFKITLYNIFNYYKQGNVELTIESDILEENNRNVINVLFSNKYGNITTYCNGKLIDIYKFDNEEYYFSNTLRDNKIFVGSSFLTDESTIDSIVLSSNNDMISSGYTIKNFSIYNSQFNYFDVINYNRIYTTNIPCYLVIPVKTRSYIEEIAGFYTQNKNLRKSEYGAITINGAELTTDMKLDVKNKINTIFDDTFINLRISNINIK